MQGGAHRVYLLWLYLFWLYSLCKAALAEYAAALAQEGGSTDEAAAQAAALSLSPTP